MAGTQSDTILHEGEVFVGRYRTVRELGQGGFGAVYEAEDIRLRRRVAIKLLHPAIAKDKKAKARFKREALAAARIDHPAVVQVLEQGETPDGTLYIVMEYVDGVTLLAELRRAHKQGVRLGATQARVIGWQTARVLARTHERGIFHRDLKPANLMLITDESVIGGLRVKILDFGIAKLRPGASSDGAQASLGLEEDEVVATSMGDQQPGTFAYMAPEQFGTYKGYTGNEGLLDVYALGVILYQVLAGRLPLYSPDPIQMMGLAISREPEPLSSIDASVPADLAQLVHRMLAKDLTQRPSMSAVCDALGQQLGFARAAPDNMHIRGTTEHALVASDAGPSLGPAAPISTASGDEAALAVTADAPPEGTTPLGTAATAGASPTTDSSADAARAQPRLSSVPSVGNRATQPQIIDDRPPVEPLSGGGQQITNPASKAQRQQQQKKFAVIGIAAAALCALILTSSPWRWFAARPTPSVPSSPVPDPGKGEPPVPLHKDPPTTPDKPALPSSDASGGPTASPTVTITERPPVPTGPTKPTLGTEKATQSSPGKTDADPHKHKTMRCSVPKESCLETSFKSASDRQAVVAALREAELRLCSGERLSFDLRAGQPTLILVPARLQAESRDALRAALLGRFHRAALSGSVSIQCK